MVVKCLRNIVVSLGHYFRFFLSSEMVSFFSYVLFLHLGDDIVYVALVDATVFLVYTASL